MTYKSNLLKLNIDQKNIADLTINVYRNHVGKYYVSVRLNTEGFSKNFLWRKHIFQTLVK